jgi:hypothetical protein
VDGIRLPYRLRRLIEGRPIREERLRRVTLNEPVSHEKFTIPAIVRAQDEAGRRIVTGWTQRWNPQLFRHRDGRSNALRQHGAAPKADMEALWRRLVPNATLGKVRTSSSDPNPNVFPSGA